MRIPFKKMIISIILIVIIFILIIFCGKKLIFDKFDKHETPFVISLTSLPNRNSNLRENIHSLITQNYKNYEVHLNLPKKTLYNGEYSNTNKPDIEESDKLKIFYVDDVGSITKIYYTLQRTKNYIISVDDDFVYHPDMLQEYNNIVKKYPNASVGFNGIYPVGKKTNGDLDFIGSPKISPVRVGAIEGYKSVCYKPEFFDKEFFEQWYNKSWNDDLIIGSWLGYKNIPKYIVSYSKEKDFKNRMISFPLVKKLDNPLSGVNHHRIKEGGSNKSYKNLWKVSFLLSKNFNS